MPAAGAFLVPPDHPCLPGHFPGQPVVPGVVLLDGVFALIAERLEGLALRELGSVKFLQPVLPGQRVEVAYELTGPGRISFDLSRDGRAVLRGTARIAA